MIEREDGWDRISMGGEDYRRPTSSWTKPWERFVSLRLPAGDWDGEDWETVSDPQLNNALTSFMGAQLTIESLSGLAQRLHDERMRFLQDPSGKAKIEELEEQIQELNQRNAELSWKLNPEAMGR